MKSTMMNDRLSSRLRVSKQPSTPETLSSRETEGEICPTRKIDTKIDLFENGFSSKLEHRLNIRRDLTEGAVQSTRTRGDNETVTCSTLTQQSERMMDDFNSIVASTEEDYLYSVDCTDSSEPQFDELDLFGNDDGLLCDGEETDSEILAVIEGIRREASSMDSIFLLDQVKTLESELEVVNKQFSARSMENENLKTELEEKGSKLAKAELERDLHQADVSKLREDLKTCVGKMFDISQYESAFSDELAHKEVQSTNKMVAREPQGPNTVTSPLSQPETLRIVGLSTQGSLQSREVVESPPVLSDPSMLAMYSKERWIDDSDSAHLLPARENDGNKRDQDVFRRRRRQLFGGRRSKSVRMKRNDFGGTELGLVVQRNRALSVPSSFSLDPKTFYPHPLDTTVEYYDDDEVDETRICGIFRRRLKRVPSSRDSTVLCMKRQIEQLHEMMKGSLTSSEKLRKRIATISRYYEGVISRLQEQVAEIKADKARCETDMRNGLCESDMVLRERDREIARLRSLLVDQGEV